MPWSVVNESQRGPGPALESHRSSAATTPEWFQATVILTPILFGR
jgi:hypothetical protein